MVKYVCPTCGNTYKSPKEMTYPPECRGKPGHPHLHGKVMKKV